MYMCLLPLVTQCIQFKKKKGRPIAFSNFSKNINDIIIAPEMIANKYHFVSCMRALVLVLHYLKYLNDKGIQF